MPVSVSVILQTFMLKCVGPDKQTWCNLSCDLSVPSAPFGHIFHTFTTLVWNNSLLFSFVLHARASAVLIELADTRWRCRGRVRRYSSRSNSTFPPQFAGTPPRRARSSRTTEQVRRRRRDSRLVSETLDAAGNTVDSRRDSVDSVGLGKMRTYEGETAQ